MAYTTPITASPGNVFHASDWNTYVRDNMATMFHADYVKNTLKDVVNTTTPTDLLNAEVTIAANRVGTSGAIWVVFLGDYLNNSGANSNLTLSIQLGGTTIWQDVVTIGTAANRHPLFFDFVIGAQNSTAVQFMSGEVGIGSGVAPTTGRGSFTGTNLAVPIASNGTTALDMTVSKTLVIQATHSVANANISARCEYAAILVKP